MPAPTPYTRSTSFTDHSVNLPTTPHRGADLDQEFDALAATSAQTIDRLSLIQRDDGALANESVGADQLAQDALDAIATGLGGLTGPQGPAGPAIPGPAGVQGPAGPPLPWIVSAGVPSNLVGTYLQLYLNTANGDVWQRDVAGWVLASNLRGPQGTGGGGTGVSDHGALTGLTDPDHPISAVQGLQAALDSLAAGITLSTASQNRTYSQTTAPTGALNAGDIWFDTDDGNRQYRYNGTAWVSVSDAQIAAAAAAAATAIANAAAAQATADGRVTTFYQSGVPSGPRLGDLWVRTDQQNRLFRWSGSAWVEITDGRVVQAINAAADAQATADGKIETFFQTTAPVGAALGDLWFDTDDGNHPYRFNGVSWQSVRDAAIAAASLAAGNAITAAAAAQATADGKIDVFYQGTAPTAGVGVGDLWVQTPSNLLHRYTGSSWLAIQDAGITGAIAAANNALTVADGKITAYYQNAAPVGAQTDDLWFDLDDGNRLYRFNGSTWVSVRDAGIDAAFTNAANALSIANAASTAVASKLTVFYQASPPASPQVGDLWIETDNGNVLTRWSGSAWINVTDARIQQALTDAALAQATADGKLAAFYQAAPPTGADPGDLWYDTDDRFRPYRWTGSAWEDITPIVGVSPGGLITGVSIADGTITTPKLAANSVTTTTLAANSVTSSKILAGAVTTDKLSVLSQNGTTIDMQNGRIVIDTGAFIKAEGVGFGSSNQFIEWFGPRPAGGNLALCTEANAISYKTITGNAYTGGTYAAGRLQNALQTTSLIATAEVIVGPFLTNGNPKTIVISYDYRNSYRCNASTGAIVGAFSASVVLERSLDGGVTWVPLVTLTPTEQQRTVIVDGAPGVQDVVIFRAAGSTTFVDNSAATSNMRLRGRISARTLPALNGTAITSVVETQTVSVSSLE